MPDDLPGTCLETNAPMAALLAAPAGADGLSVPSPFQLLVFGGFRDVDGCVFFRELFRHHNVTECALATFQDRTGLECYVNKIHLEDFLEEGTTLDGPSLARLAVRCSRLLASHPRKKFPGRPFRIIVSVDGRVCTLRFHKIRPGELWLQDLHLVEEALLVVDFSPGAEGRS